MDLVLCVWGIPVYSLVRMWWCVEGTGSSASTLTYVFASFFNSLTKKGGFIDH